MGKKCLLLQAILCFLSLNKAAERGSAPALDSLPGMVLFDGKEAQQFIAWKYADHSAQKHNEEHPAYRSRGSLPIPEMAPEISPAPVPVAPPRRRNRGEHPSEHIDSAWDNPRPQEPPPFTIFSTVTQDRRLGHAMKTLNSTNQKTQRFFTALERLLCEAAQEYNERIGKGEITTAPQGSSGGGFWKRVFNRGKKKKIESITGTLNNDSKEYNQQRLEAECKFNEPIAFALYCLEKLETLENDAIKRLNKRRKSS